MDEACVNHDPDHIGFYSERNLHGFRLAAVVHSGRFVHPLLLRKIFVLCRAGNVCGFFSLSRLGRQCRDSGPECHGISAGNRDPHGAYDLAGGSSRGDSL